jgi:septal ring factor EnvC (AmiA/AmiB activator)
MRLASLLLVFLLLAAGLGGAGPVPAAASATEGDDLPRRVEASSRELAKLHDQIESHRSELCDLSQQEDDAEAKLGHLTEEMGLIKELLASLDAREQILQEQSEELQEQLTVHRREQAARQEALARRLRALYMRGRHGRLNLLLTADGFSSLLTRLKYTTLMARLDERLISDARQEGEQIESAQRQLRAALAGVWEAREEARQERTRLEEMDQERRSLLTQLKERRASAERELSSLQEREASLQGILAELERLRLSRPAPTPDDSTAAGRASPPGGLSGLAGLAGQLEWPASGALVERFGQAVHPEFKTVTLHNGITIGADRGSPVYAVAGGKVEFADRLPGFGACIILDHGAGFYTLYAHLERVFVTRGGLVTQGEILAEVGESPADGRSGLYFEIRRGKTPLDPVDWLRPRRP